MTEDRETHDAIERRVRESFARQPLMTTIGAAIAEVSPGCVVVELPVDARLTQQHGFVHGGVIATIGDTACGYAALSSMPPDVGVLTLELKVNYLAPATGERLLATGQVKRAGRTVTLVVCDVETEAGGERRLVAHMTATMIAVEGRADVVD